ncbi:MFS transporter [Streptomyces sp. NPDC048291]|uniref:MFS transporter n=1 Tax=Streptomyces sp. NPDC048291 TaxID=3365530 RepID=UPI00371B7541
MPSVSWLLATSIVGRFNQGMTGLALLLLTTQHASYTVYSIVSAANAAGSFISGPLLSRLADTHGRRGVLAWTAVSYAVTMAVFAVTPPRPELLVCLSFLAGLCTPPMLSAVRAALPALLPAELRRTFFAVDATAQELVLVLGPTATAALAAVGGPRLAVAACGGLVLAGTLAYVRDRNAEAGRSTTPRVKGELPLRGLGLPRLCTAGALLTCALGAQVVGVVALVSGQHASAGAGLVLSCGSFGSLLGGVAHGLRRGRRVRLRYLILYVAAGLAALPLAPNTAVLAVIFFCSGFAVAPTLSTLFEWLSERAPEGSAAEVFGWVGSILLVGNVLGTVLGGALVSAYGAAFPNVAGCGLAVLAALLCERKSDSGGHPAGLPAVAEGGPSRLEPGYDRSPQPPARP